MARDHRAAPEADAGPGAQQDARRPAVLRVPGVLPRQRRRVLRLLLRLLPARGVPAPVGHLHREGLEPERGDRPAPPRRDPRPVRAPRRDHRRVRVVHLRPGRAGRLRGHRPPAPHRRPVPARRRAPAPRRPPVPAQRRRRCHARRFRVRGDTLEIRPGERRDHRPGRVLRRRGRADHRARPADRRAARRAQGAQRLPGHPLRDAEGQAPAGDRRPSRARWRSGSGSWSTRAARSRRRACASGRRSTSRCSASSATAPASRTTAGTSASASRARGRGRCSTTSRRTGC